jgi:hypothetical protein
LDFGTSENGNPTILYCAVHVLESNSTLMNIKGTTY